MWVCFGWRNFEQGNSREKVVEMSESNEHTFPVPSIRRLPLYLSFLRKLREQNVEVVSSTRIAEELGLTGIQVRKDLAMTSIVGRPKVGHSINELVSHIERFLGWDQPHPAFLVGVGHLGTALLGYKGFEQENLNILASFDNSPQKIGKTILGRPIYPISEFAAKAKEMCVKCAILTVPAAYAQEIADLMVEAGIQGIWNFAPVQLFVPKEIIVENVSLSSSMAVLSQRMAAQSRPDYLNWDLEPDVHSNNKSSLDVNPRKRVPKKAVPQK